MNNWINNLHLDLIKQNSMNSITASKSFDSPPTSPQSPVTDPQTPVTPTSSNDIKKLSANFHDSTNNLVDSNVNFHITFCGINT
jgi:hypothetical protein